MKKKIFVIGTIAIFLGLIFSAGCIDNQGPEKETEKELLIYCGITMIDPMSEIAEIIEEQENCKIIITKGGSGNLLDSIRINQVGDLYLPGSDSYIETCLSEGLITDEDTDTVLVGYNKAAIMVQNGNPKNISANLTNFLNESYIIYLGNPDSGSIGKETKKIFEKKGIWDNVSSNAAHFTTDSKDLSGCLIDKTADLVINWYATSTWEYNEPYIDALPINEEYATKKKLVLGLLTTSEYPEIAREFMEYASSDEGRVIFNKYGLYDIE